MTETRRSLLLVLLAWLVFPCAGHAHRLDEYLQATLVVIEPDELRLLINLTPGVDVAESILALIDRNQDGVISPSEAAAYATLLKSDLILGVDGRNSVLKLSASDFPKPSELRDGWGIIQLEFSANPGTLAAGPHRLTLQNQHLPSLSIYLCNAAQPTSSFIQITTQERNANQSLGSIDFTFQPPTNTSRPTAIMTGLTGLLVAGIAAGWRVRKNTLLSDRSSAPASQETGRFAP